MTSSALSRRLSFCQRARAGAIAAGSYPIIATLGRTLRWTVEGQEHEERVRTSGRQPVFAFWHGRILLGTYFYRRRGIVVMTSENFDGEWIARIIERFGYQAARGSSSRGGHRALARMRSVALDGAPTAFTVDGPRGPAQCVQPGAVWLASLTGNPVIPFHAETDRYWTARSWDATQVPKPFARVAMVIGEPIDVPNRSDPNRLEEKRVELEDSLYRLSKRARQILGARR